MNRYKTVMIVEDDTDDAEFICEVITKTNLGIERIMAYDGVDALKKLRPENIQLPNIIFLDLNMPLMDGRSCLMELKKDENLKHIPVIVISTSSYQKEIDEMYKLGAVYYLSKRYDFNTFCKKIIFVLNTDWSVNTSNGSLQTAISFKN